METTVVTLATIMSNVTSLTSGVESMFSTFSEHWFVFLPITFTVFGFLFGKFKSIMMYRKGRRRG